MISFLVLKKYVPGITHHQLCTVANWNPQLSKDFLLSMGHSPQKKKHFINKNKTISVVSGCDAAAHLFDPSCPPLHPLQKLSKLLQTGNRSAFHRQYDTVNLYWHIMHWHLLGALKTVTIAGPFVGFFCFFFKEKDSVQAFFPSN